MIHLEIMAGVALALLVLTMDIKSVVAEGPKDQKDRCPASKQVIHVSCLTALK